MDLPASRSSSWIDDVQPGWLDVLHSRSPADLERMRVLTSNMSGFKSLRLVRESV